MFVKPLHGMTINVPVRSSRTERQFTPPYGYRLSFAAMRTVDPRNPHHWHITRCICQLRFADSTTSCIDIGRKYLIGHYNLIESRYPLCFRPLYIVVTSDMLWEPLLGRYDEVTWLFRHFLSYCMTSLVSEKKLSPTTKDGQRIK